MTFTETIFSLIMSILASLACGLAYAFAADDTKPRKRKTIAVSMVSGVAGWGFTFFLPMYEYKYVAAIVLALITAIYGSHIYWFIFKEKSHTTKIIDANHHHPHPGKTRKGAFNSI